MSREIQAFQVTTPAGTPQSAPLVTNLAMPPRIVNRIEVLVPPGPNGVLGFAFGAAGQRVIPYNANAWVIASDSTLGWDLAEQIQSGAWQLQSYNTGLYPHTIYIRFVLSLVQDPAAADVPLLSMAVLVPDNTPPDLGSVDTSGVDLSGVDLPPMDNTELVQT